MRTSILALLLATLLATPAAQSQQFVLSSRDRAQLLAIDFVAAGPDGSPVGNLTAGEVTVRLGGKTRPIVVFEYVRAVKERRDATDAAAPFGDNAEWQAPRSIILMVDEDTIRPGRTITVRDAVQQLLAGLAPADRVALVTVPFGGLAVDLTTDHARVMQAVGNLTSKSLRAESVLDAQCRTLSTLGAMTDTLLRLSVVEEPVTVVFFSSSQAGPQNIIRMTGAAPVGGPCDLRTSTFTDLGIAAARARARFYVVHSDLDQRASGLEGLEHITGVTGGPLLHLSTGEGRPAVTRILRETSGHYIARVAREPSDAIGEDLGVGVSTSRPGVTVWRAPRFIVTRPNLASSTTPATTLDLIRNARVFRDLPLRITGHTFRDDTEGHVKLAVTFESSDATAILSSAMVAAFDSQGRLVTGIEMSSEALTMRPVVAALSVPPGVYRIRIAAIESTGRAGSAEQDVVLALTPVGPIEVSSLMVGLSRNGVYVPAMVFGTEPTAFGMLEIYGAALTPESTPGVVFEIAATTLGQAILTMPGLVEPTGDSSRSVATAVLPIQDLAPGDYVVRATITVAGHPSGRVLRTLRKIGS
jgi:hypothetical protein